MNMLSEESCLNNSPLNDNLTIRDNPETWSLFMNFAHERNIKEGTLKGYESSLNKFCRFIGDNDLNEFIEDCLREEDEKVPERKKKVKKVLLDYRTSLLNTPSFTHNSVKSYMGKIRTFLRHHEITVPDLPVPKYEKSYQASYFDLPSHEDIRSIVLDEDVHTGALILFMSSSGTARAETLSITVGVFLDACEEYYPSELRSNIGDVVDYLLDCEDVVPIFRMHRFKTDKDYYTCCSPEAVTYILQSLRSRINAGEVSCEDDKLFPFNKHTLMVKFKRINDKHGWGFVGRYRFFRSHVLRKFFASNSGLSREWVDALEGRSKDEIGEAYFKTNPLELRDVYRSCMHRVMVLDRGGVYSWDSVPPTVKTRFDDDGGAVISLSFRMPAEDVANCMRFINNTFYTKKGKK